MNQNNYKEKIGNIAHVSLYEIIAKIENSTFDHKAVALMEVCSLMLATALMSISVADSSSRDEVTNDAVEHVKKLVKLFQECESLLMNSFKSAESH